MRRLVDKKIKDIVLARQKGLISQYEYRVFLAQLCVAYGDKLVAKRAKVLGVS